MKKRFLAVAAILALCMTMLAVGLSVNAASETYTYTMLQDFESADANTDAYIWGDGGLLTFAADASVKNTGNQSVKVTMGGTNTATGQVVNNLYPRPATNDFSGFDGICYWIKTDAGTTVSDVEGTKMVGRVEGYVQTSAARYAIHSSAGDIYMVADGTTDMVAMVKAGDGRYWLPANFTGYIYVPFASLAGWSADVDLSAVAEMALAFHCGDFADNVYYVDSVQGYAEAAEEPSATAEKMLQDFESADANTDAYIWGDGGLLTFAADASVKNTGNQSVKVTMGGTNTATGQPVNNLYPKLSVTDFTGYEGFRYWIKTDVGTTVSDVEGTKMVGRVEGYVQTSAARYAIHSSAGDIYMVSDGTTDKVAMVKSGYGRYWLPANFTGYI